MAKEKRKISKEDIVTVLKPHVPIKHPKSLISAFRALIWKFSEICEFTTFEEIVKKEKSLPYLADLILKSKRNKTRTDADEGSKKRNSAKYTGRKKGVEWNLLKEGEKILISRSHLTDWFEKFGIDEAKYLNLSTQTINSFMLGTPIHGFNKEAVSGMKKELLVLLFVLVIFGKELEKAIRQKNIYLLYSTEEVWAEDVEDIKTFFKINFKANKKQGRRITPQSVQQRLFRVMKYLYSDKPMGNQPGKFHKEDKPLLICILAHEAYKTLFNPIESLKKRTEALIQIKELVIQHSITPKEIFPFLK